MISYANLSPPTGHRTEEDDDGVDLCPLRLLLLRVQGEAYAVGAVEVPEYSFADERQEGDDETQDPDGHQDGDGTTAAWRQVAEWIDDADVLLQRQVGEQQHTYLCGQHSQRAHHLTGRTVHPSLRVAVVLAAELQIVCTDHEQVHTHEAVSTCERTEEESVTLHLTRQAVIATYPVTWTGLR